MEGFFFVFVFAAMAIAAVIGILIPLARQYAKKTNEAWRAAARALGLAYQEPRFTIRRKIHGRLQENEITVDTYTRSSGKSNQTFTRFTVRYPRPLGLGLRLTREGFFSSVGKMFGAQDIEVGDGAFDADVIVKGHDPRRVVAFLTFARRSRIHRALMSFSGLTIGDSEIRWTRRGLVRDANTIIRTVRRLSQLAWFLTGDREEDGKLESAISLQREGRIEEALESARSVPVLDAVEPVEARVLEGEMLYLGGRKEEAARVFERAEEEAPDDPEIRGWIRHVKGREHRAPRKAPAPARVAPASPGDTSPPPGDESTTAPPAAYAEPLDAAAGGVEAEEPAAPADLSAAEVCAELFPPGSSSLDTSRIFGERYEGTTVRWTGVLERLESFTFDYVFGEQPGTKAIVKVYEQDEGLYSSREVRALVRLDSGLEETLRDRVGGQLTFEGRLLQADGLMRNVYVAEGRVVDDA